MPFGKRRERVESGQGFKIAEDYARKLLKDAVAKKKENDGKNRKT